MAITLGVVTLVTRWIVRGHSLVSYDAGLLASGIEDYDFDEESPHPPFYPLTIAAGKLFATAVGPVDALVLLSVISSGVMAAATFAIARQLGGRAMSTGAAVFVILSPTALFNGSVALSYASEGAASAVLAFGALRLRRAPSLRSGIITGCALSIAAGLRPSAALFLAPLTLWAAWRSKDALKGAFLGGAATTVAWLVPTLIAGGGLRDFTVYNGYQSSRVILSRTIFDDGWVVAAGHLHRLQTFAPNEVELLLAVAAVAAVAAFALRRALASDEVAFLAVWTLPGLLFYVFLYVGWPSYPSGYVMVLLPAAAIAAALLLERTWLVVRASDAPRAAQAMACVVILAVAAIPLSWPAQWEDAMRPQRAADARDRDWADAQEAFPPNETAFLTSLQWHWARTEHPEYLVWGVRPYWNETGILLFQVTEARYGHMDRPMAADFLDGPYEPPHPIPSWVRKVVVLDEGAEAALVKANVTLAVEHLPSGRAVRTFDPTGFDSIEQGLPWFDASGRLDPSTLGTEDVRGK